ncbi:hypothetical protein [Streptomyces sp. t39]|uniref:hypothetical protein n=1 Tax=Streptomyces sp. t39 TaxID=1828156 RepID=UPI0011CDF286|nr:hypothetical protein [Streptomyces sp. t39]TXS42223.1 hypothetical protein EAO77_35580 [Streptomyces sp. t39]
MNTNLIPLPVDVDMSAVAAELHEALAHIEDLRHQHPYDATGYRSEPVWHDVRAPGHAPIPTPRSGHGPCITKTNPNTKTNTKSDEIPARTPEMAA